MIALPEKYLNQVVNDDVMNVLRDLPDNCVDMIYGDPDYNAGISYSGRTFTRSWDAYVDWYIELARESLRVLRDDGNMYLINYPKQNAHLRVRFLDDHAVGVHEYVWVYNTNVGHSRRRFTTAHRSILHATKSKKNRFYKEQVAQPYKNPTDRRIRERIKQGHKGRMPYSWLNFNLVKNVSPPEDQPSLPDTGGPFRANDKVLHPARRHRVRVVWGQRFRGGAGKELGPEFPDLRDSARLLRNHRKPTQAGWSHRIAAPQPNAIKAHQRI